MKKDDKPTEKKQPQQRPEDAEKHNAQQEREYREQEKGKKGKFPDQPTEEEAIEKYDDIKKDGKENKKEEE